MAWLDAERATLVALIVHLADHGHHAAAREIGDLRLQAFILLDLADAQVRLGHPDEAEVAVHDVLTVAGQINSRLLERQARRVIPDYAR